MTYYTFDIEVTSLPDHKALPYLWVVSKDGKSYEYGRYLPEFKLWLDAQPHDEKVIIYVHNLSYEYQFLKGILDFSTEKKAYLFTDQRKCCKVTYQNFEFRDSYVWTNMSLKNFLETYDCKIQKLPYDYDKVRTPKTPLTDDELKYCVCDTLGLWEAVSKKLKFDGDTLKSTPITSTGFVRRDVKSVLTKEQRGKFRKMNAAPDNYRIIRDAFRGGNTFANPKAVGKVYDNVICSDITSSYPTRQLHNKFPSNDFRPVENFDGVCNPNYRYIFRIRYTNLSTMLMDDPCPPLSLSKCEYMPKDVYYDSVNGRIIEGESIVTTVCDVEEGIMRRHYEWDKMEYLEVYRAPADYIPLNIKEVILGYYETKSTAKGLERKLAKARLNSIYGMSAQDIGKDNWIMDETGVVDSVPSGTLLNNPAEPYSWGLYTTAYARDALDRVIMEHLDTFLYCDTDSVFLQGEAIEEEPLVEGTELGQWRVDKICKQFKTLGAKRYMYIDENDERHMVVAGVKSTAEIPTLDEFKTGLVIKDATTTSYYNDEATIVEGYNVPSSVCIEKSDYTMTVIPPNIRYMEVDRYG